MKTSDVILLGAIGVAAYFFLKKNDGSSEEFTTIPNAVPTANTPESVPYVRPEMIISPKIAAQAIVTPTAAIGEANPSMPKALSLVKSKGTSSVADIQAQRAASMAGQSYSGVSGGVVYKVSAPKKPSEKQAAALRQAGYGKYA